MSELLPPAPWPDRDPLARRIAHPGSARARRGRSRSPPRGAARPPREGADGGARWAWRVGLAGTPAVAGAANRAPRRAAVLHHHRSDTRPTLVQRRHPSRPAPDGRRSGCTSALCAAPAPARPCRGDDSRRRAADRHPAPARPQQPRHHLGLSPRHRQRRDHRDCPRPPRTDDPGQRIHAPLHDSAGCRRSSRGAAADDASDCDSAPMGGG